MLLTSGYFHLNNKYYTDQTTEYKVDGIKGSAFQWVKPTLMVAFHLVKIFFMKIHSDKSLCQGQGDKEYWHKEEEKSTEAGRQK